VSMFFTMQGTLLLMQGVAKTVCAAEEGRPISQFIQDTLSRRKALCAGISGLSDGHAGECFSRGVPGLYVPGKGYLLSSPVPAAGRLNTKALAGQLRSCLLLSG
jgi:hypothetical protein